MNEFLLIHKEKIIFNKVIEKDNNKKSKTSYYNYELYKILLDCVLKGERIVLITNNEELQDMALNVGKVILNDNNKSSGIEIYRINYGLKFNSFNKIVSEDKNKKDEANDFIKEIQGDVILLEEEIKKITEERDLLLKTNKELEKNRELIKNNSFKVISDIKETYKAKIVELEREKENITKSIETFKKENLFLQTKINRIETSHKKELLEYKQHYEKKIKVFQKKLDSIESTTDEIVEVNCDDYKGDIFSYIKRQNFLAIKCKIKNGLDINTVDELGNSLLHRACETGNLEIVNYLINKEDIDLNKKNKIGWTTLHNMARVGNLEIIRLLLNKGASKEIKTDRKLISRKMSIEYPSFSLPLDIAVLSNYSKNKGKILQELRI